MNWLSHTLWGHETTIVHCTFALPVLQTLLICTGTNHNWSFMPVWNHNSSHKRLWKCDVLMTSLSVSGDWMTILAAFSNAHFAWGNNQVSASSWFDWRSGISEQSCHCTYAHNFSSISKPCSDGNDMNLIAVLLWWGLSDCTVIL